MSLRRLVLIPFLTLLLVLSGCSLLPGAKKPDQPATSEPPAPPPFPVSQFAPIPNQRTTGVDDVIDEVAADGDFVVGLGWTSGDTYASTYRWSEDGGRTWQETEVSRELRELWNVSHLTRTPTGWWALARDEDGYVSVTSTDGKAWSMAKIDKAVLDPSNTYLSEVVLSGDKLIAGGSISPATGDLEVGFWTSLDGTDWKRSGGRGKGNLNSVAIQGNTVVAVGSKTGSGDEQTIPVVWRSADAGATWREQPRPEVGRTDSEFVSDLTAVKALDKGFVATLHGADTRGEYRPASYLSRDGKRWSREASSARISGADIDSVDLVGDGDAMVLEVNPQKEKSGDKPVIYRRSGGAWQPAKIPTGLTGRGEWSINAVVQTGSGLLAFAQRNTANTDTASIWRSTDDGATFTEEKYPAAKADLPVVAPGALARTADGFVAVGNANGFPAIWYSQPDGTFGDAAPLSTNLDHTVEGVASNQGQIVAWGQQRTLVNDQVIAWQGQRGGKLSLLDATFEADGDYSMSSVASTRYLAGAWWMVGNTSSNSDANRSALVLSGKTPDSLVRGRSSKISQRSSGEFGSFELSDLSGNDDNKRTMYDIAEGPTGMFAVGATSNRTGDLRPAYWTQGKDQKWSLKRLPMTGMVSGGASGVLVTGQTIVLSGDGRAGDDAEVDPYFWVSVDGGRTWKIKKAETPDPKGWVGRPSATDKGFVAIGTTGVKDADPVLYTSTNGLDWKPTP
ncbi:MAG: glycoside hydrolase, partial [Propionibacteriales bacterium]|nr:glycoside hydrolase [Propionibacteriales bacterium]